MKLNGCMREQIFYWKSEKNVRKDKKLIEWLREQMFYWKWKNVRKDEKLNGSMRTNISLKVKKMGEKMRNWMDV